MAFTWSPLLTPRVASVPMLRGGTRGATRSLSGLTQRVYNHAGFWEVTQSYDLRSTAQIRAMKEMLTRLAEGEEVTLKICDRQRPYLTGSAATTTLAAAAAARATSMSIVGAGVALAAGDHFSIANQLYRVRSVTDAGANKTVEFRPPLRASASAAETVNFDNLTMTAEAADPEGLEATLDQLRFGTVTITFHESALTGMIMGVTIVYHTGQSNGVGKGTNISGLSYYPTPIQLQGIDSGRILIWGYVEQDMLPYIVGINSHGKEVADIDLGTARVWGDEAQLSVRIAEVTNDVVIHVKLDEGGSGMNAWTPPSGMYWVDSVAERDAVEAWLAARNMVVNARYWHHAQGETDADNDTLDDGEVYPATFEGQLASLATEMFKPIADGGFSIDRAVFTRTAKYPKYDAVDIVRAAQHSVATTHANASQIALISSDDFEFEDRYHYNHTGQVKHGDRVFEALFAGSANIENITASHYSFQNWLSIPFMTGASAPASNAVVGTPATFATNRDPWNAQQATSYTWDSETEYNPDLSDWWEPTTVTANTNVILERDFAAAKVIKAVRVHCPGTSNNPTNARPTTIDVQYWDPSLGGGSGAYAPAIISGDAVDWEIAPDVYAPAVTLVARTLPTGFAKVRIILTDWINLDDDNPPHIFVEWLEAVS